MLADDGQAVYLAGFGQVLRRKLADPRLATHTVGVAVRLSRQTCAYTPGIDGLIVIDPGNVAA